MSDLPPPFFSEPARALHVETSDDAYTGPDRLARETAIVTVNRDDSAMAEALGRGWRSGAPEELLTGLLTTYACAHGLGPEEMRAIAAAARFVPAPAGRTADNHVDLLRRVGSAVMSPLSEALASVQEDHEPCWCPACIAEAASLN